MKIMSVVGARPNFMKAAPIIAAIQRFNDVHSTVSSRQNGKSVTKIEHTLVHTGQHYDAAMSDQFFADLNMPKPDIHLGVGGGSHAVQTAEILKKFEEVLVMEQPDVLIVVGDVNSTVACALAAVKLPTDAGQHRPIVVHVESGLRSFDRSMPEEHNRIMTDHLADVLFVTEPSGLKNLKKEGVSSRNVHFVGNTMIDTLLAFQEKAEASGILQTLGLRDGIARSGSSNCIAPYALLTLHRPANVDNRDSFADILEGLADLAKKMPIVFPAHPRTHKRIEEFGLSHLFHSLQTSEPQQSLATGKPRPGIQLITPCGYLDFVCLMKNARLVVTDSGGIQEETTCLGVPCVTVRENTERPVTITSGTNVLAGVRPAGIRKAIRKQLSHGRRGTRPLKWDGKSAGRIVEILARKAYHADRA